MSSLLERSLQRSPCSSIPSLGKKASLLGFKFGGSGRAKCHNTSQKIRETACRESKAQDCMQFREFFMMATSK